MRFFTSKSYFSFGLIVGTLFTLLSVLRPSHLQAQCGNISPATINCPDIPVSIPYQLNFDGTEGGILDNNGLQTGFTMVQAHSEARLAADLPQTFPSIPGYEPSKINISGGQLLLNSSRGLAYLDPPASSNNNAQVNTLGVGLQVSNRHFMIESTLINPSTGGGFAQTGIWYGIDEDNFVKLALVNNNDIELRVENNGTSSNTTQLIELNNLAIPGNDLRFRLAINNTLANPTVTAYLKIGNEAEIEVGTLEHNFANGITLADGTTTEVSFAGIYNSYRNGTSFTTSFEDFKVQDYLRFDPQKITLQIEENTSLNVNAVLNASANPPSLALNKSGLAPWLNLPTAATGNLSFGIDVSSLNIGDIVSVSVLAQANNFLDGIIEFEIEVIPVQMEFRPGDLHFVVFENGNSVSQSIELYNSAGAIPITLSSGAGSTWLNLPTSPTSGILNLEVDPTGLNAGDQLSTILTASASGYADATLNIEVLVIGFSSQLQVNFQDETTTPPAGWSKDFGEAFAARTGIDQGFGLSYGWRNQVDDAAIDISNNGRLRPNPGGDLISRTLMHMQLGGDFYWEIALPNGSYEVEVRVGDGGGATDSEHIVRVEGETAINSFIPTANEFSTASVKVVVNDGRLTIDALGGDNTKINSLIIQPISNVLEFDQTNLNFIVYSGEIAAGQTAILSAETGTLPTYTITREQNDPVFISNPAWLILNNDPLTGEVEVSVDITSLAPGYYEGLVRADAAGYLDGELVIGLRVLDPITDLQINFQDELTTPPSGWLKDFGEPYGLKTSSNEQGLVYGWRDADNYPNPVSLVGNGRNRNTGLVGDEKIEATLVHLQYDDLSRAFGVAVEGIWEIALPNGAYEVEVRVGDILFETTNNTLHSLNVQYVPYFERFETQPSELSRTITQQVSVTNGVLRIDALGGFNSKIMSLKIRKVNVPSLNFSQNFISTFSDGEELTQALESILSASVGSPTVTLTKTLDTGVDWLSLPTPSLGNLDFATDTENLESDTYYATIVASAPGYTNTALRIELKQVSINWLYRVNFQNTFIGVPANYIPDYGFAYGTQANGATYGWTDLAGVPADNQAGARYRNAVDVNVRLNTLNHLRHPSNPARNWEIEVPNGIYYISLAVGDPISDDSVHDLILEGENVIDNFVQSGSTQFYETAVKIIKVEDGKISLSVGDEDLYTKINYIKIAPYELPVKLIKSDLPVLAGGRNRAMTQLIFENDSDFDISIMDLGFSLAGTNAANVENARLFYSADEDNFYQATPVGTPVLNPNGDFDFNTLNILFNSGDIQYIWLAYDIAANASLGDVVSALSPRVNLGYTNYTPLIEGLEEREIRETDTEPGLARDFSTVGNYAEVEKNFDLAPNFSFETWLFPQQSGASPRWVLGQVNGSHLEQVGNQLHFYVLAEGTLQGPAVANVELNAWNHAAASYDGTNLRIYVNGIEGTPATLLSGNTGVDGENVDTPFSFGAQNQFDIPNNILLDEIRVWDNARSQADIRLDMHLVLTGLESDLKAYWQFNENQLIELANDFQATLVGTPAQVDALEPVGIGASQSEIITGAGLQDFGPAKLEITFGADNPGGEVVATYLENTAPGTDPAPGIYKMPGYWIVDNYGDNDIDPVRLKFNLEDGVVLSAVPGEYRLHKRGSRESGAWTNIDDAPGDISIELGTNPGMSYVEFIPEISNTVLRGFSQFALSSDQTYLPLTLLSFTGERSSEQVRLNWTTVQEINTLSFEIEQSYDGQNFVKIAETDAQGDAAELTQYSLLYTETEAAYYRLRQLDQDGRFTYSPTIFIEAQEALGLKVYPNPFVREIHIESSMDTQSIWYLGLFDTQGNEQLNLRGNLKQVEEELNQGLTSLSAGVYILRLQSSNFQKTIKIIKR